MPFTYLLPLNCRAYLAKPSELGRPETTAAQVGVLPLLHSSTMKSASCCCCSGTTSTSIYTDLTTLSPAVAAAYSLGVKLCPSTLPSGVSGSNHASLNLVRSHRC